MQVIGSAARRADRCRRLRAASNEQAADHACAALSKRRRRRQRLLPMHAAGRHAATPAVAATSSRAT